MLQKISTPSPLIVILSLIAFCSSYYVSYAMPDSFSKLTTENQLNSTIHLQIDHFIIEHWTKEIDGSIEPLQTHKNFLSVTTYLRELSQDLHDYNLQLPTVKIYLIDGKNLQDDALTRPTDDEILIYENDMDVRQVVAHEVGHLIDSHLMNPSKWLQYQKIRQFPMNHILLQARLKWEERPSEMFAEDFASVFTGTSRFSETPFQYLQVKQFMIDLIQEKNM